jgi:hypothetical protein
MTEGTEFEATYEAPQLTEYGTVEDYTQGIGISFFFDFM